jgi:hypothetical protein
MKRTELQSLINECIGEVLNEGRANKKKLAIREIKRIIAENEIGEAELLKEFDLFKSKATKEKEAAELKTDKDRLTAQFEKLKSGLSNQKATIEDALALAARFKDNFKGDFVVRGKQLNYEPAKDKNPLQGRTGGRK